MRSESSVGSISNETLSNFPLALHFTNLQRSIQLSEIQSRIIEQPRRWRNIKEQLAGDELVQPHHILPLERVVCAVHVRQLLWTNDLLII